jgi:hypothetical protein
VAFQPLLFTVSHWGNRYCRRTVSGGNSGTEKLGLQGCKFFTRKSGADRDLWLYVMWRHRSKSYLYWSTPLLLSFRNSPLGLNHTLYNRLQALPFTNAAQKWICRLSKINFCHLFLKYVLDGNCTRYFSLHFSQTAKCVARQTNKRMKKYGPFF